MIAPTVRARRGFTLIELLVTLVIIGVIAPSLYLAFSIGWKAVDTAMTSSLSSQKEALLTVHYTRDVAAAAAVSPVEPVQLSPATPCRTVPGLTVTKTLVTFVVPGGTVSYVTAPSQVTSSPTSLLVRVACTGTPHEVILARDITGVPTVVCTGTPTCRNVDMTLVQDQRTTLFSATRRTT